MNRPHCLLCLLMLSIFPLTGCASRYYEDLPPLINNLDLESGLYRMVVHGYVLSDGKIISVHTLLPAESVPDCQRVIGRRRVLYCASHPIRVIFQPRLRRSHPRLIGIGVKFDILRRFSDQSLRWRIRGTDMISKQQAEGPRGTH